MRFDEASIRIVPERLTRGMLAQAGIRVKQAIPGRLRVRVRTLERHAVRCGWMRSRLQAFPGVTAVETRLLTGSVIVVFLPGKVSVRTLLAIVLNQVRAPLTAPIEDAPPAVAPNRACSCVDSAAGPSFSRKIRRVLWLTGCMGWALARKWIFALPLAQTPFSLLGAVALLSALPLAGDAIRETRTRKKLTVTPFLAAGSLITIAMGHPFSALQILWIYNVAEVTEEYVARRSRRAIRDILEVAPSQAYVMIDGMEVAIAVADLRPGDLVAVHAGERIPVDGVVTEGEALVDESSINGRSEPMERTRGDRVFAGTILSQGMLFIHTEQTGEGTYLAHIARMVEEALTNRAPVEQKADQLANRLLKTGLVATALTFLLTLDPTRTLTMMLVMSCPCATVLAASSAITAALANAARRSILIKGGLYLESVGRAEVYCFDKTGTMTMEQPQVVSVTTAGAHVAENEVLSMAATAESHNQHPVAQAILEAVRERSIEVSPHAVCDFKAGRGVLCTVGGDAVILVGSRRFMDEHEVDTTAFADAVARQQALGNSVVYVARNGSALGCLGIANPMRPEAREVLHNLRGDGVRALHLVTGDSTESAAGLLSVLPFDAWRAELMPEDKARWIKELQRKSGVVMVGDGVNDALALAQADIGIAMGAAGAEVALEAADIALADSNLEGLMRLRNLSHKTMQVIDQNHFLAVSTDIIGAVLAMVGVLSPVMAGMIHILHTGGILLNSGRMLSWEPPVTPRKRLPGQTGPVAPAARSAQKQETENKEKEAHHVLCS
ncbi:MAG: heavy metal translocating P-type ATPase [Desulfobulbus sp.]|jgi:cation-transporting P-type ATPase C